MKCINCAYFLNCDMADKAVTECEKFIKRTTYLNDTDGYNFDFKEVNK